MIKLEPFSFCTNTVPGSDLLPALDMARQFGFRWVELSAIDGISEQINVDLISPAYVSQIRKQLEQRALQCIAVSGHGDMTDSSGFSRLLRKIEFAGEIGAKWLNTRCGSPDRMDEFLKHVKIAAEKADRYGVVLNLESYGDIVGSASQCGSVFDRLNLPNVRYNYDPGNTFRFARGNVCIEEDLANTTVTLEYLHLKDSSLRDGWIWNDAIGSGQLNYPAILEQLDKQRTDSLPCGLELPMGFRVWCKDLSFDFLNPSLNEVERAVQQSLEYLQRYALFV